MSNPRIKIIDTQDDNKEVLLEELTALGLGILVHQCRSLLFELQEARAKAIDDEGDIF